MRRRNRFLNTAHEKLRTRILLNRAARRGTENPPWVMVSLAVEESSGHRLRPFRHQPGYLVKKRKTIRIKDQQPVRCDLVESRQRGCRQEAKRPWDQHRHAITVNSLISLLLLMMHTSTRAHVKVGTLGCVSQPDWPAVICGA
ncbi:hypothetical protein Tco_1446548 [Tanacetum coccineum]